MERFFCDWSAALATAAPDPACDNACGRRGRLRRRERLASAGCDRSVGQRSDGDHGRSGTRATLVRPENGDGVCALQHSLCRDGRKAGHLGSSRSLRADAGTVPASMVGPLHDALDPPGLGERRDRALGRCGLAGRAPGSRRATLGSVRRRGQARSRARRVDVETAPAGWKPRRSTVAAVGCGALAVSEDPRPLAFRGRRRRCRYGHSLPLQRRSRNLSPGADRGHVETPTLDRVQSVAGRLSR